MSSQQQGSISWSHPLCCWCFGWKSLSIYLPVASVQPHRKVSYPLESRSGKAKRPNLGWEANQGRGVRHTVEESVQWSWSVFGLQHNGVVNAVRSLQDFDGWNARLVIHGSSLISFLMVCQHSSQAIPGIGFHRTDNSVCVCLCACVHTRVCALNSVAWQPRFLN